MKVDFSRNSILFGRLSKEVASTGEFWTHDAREGLKVALLFAQWLPLLFLFAPIPPCIFPARAVRMYCPHGLHNPALKGDASTSREQ
jgi:hypothetical protein